MPSLVWRFFTLNNEKTKAICNLCSKDVCYLNKTTTNLLRHVRSNHRTELDAVSPSNPTQGPSASKKEKKDVQHSDSHPTPSIKDAFAKMQKYKPTSNEKCTIDGLVLNMIVQDMQPLSVVENEGFRSLITRLDPRYEIVSRSHLTNVLLPDRYKDEKEKLIHELSTIDYVAATTDHWTSRANDSYATMTAHYITDQWVLKSPVLFTRAEGRRQTAVILSEEMSSALEEFEIKEKVTAIVTDNAPNATKSVKLLEKGQINCFAHTLNLTVTDGIKRDEPTKRVVKKVKDIVTFFHSSTVATKALKDSHKATGTTFYKLKQEVETRWNSKFTMMESYVQQHDQITTVLVLKGKMDSVISNEELGKCKDIMATLGPFYLATTEMSGEKMTSISKVIPIVNLLRKKLEKDDSGLAAQLLESLNLRFVDIETNKFLSLATLLDPRFKEKAFANPQNARAAIQQLTHEADLAISQQDQQQKEHTEQKTKTSFDSFWEEFDDETNVDEESSLLQTPGEAEVQVMLSSKRIDRHRDPLLWWKSQEGIMPRLSKLCKQILCIPATSVPSERVFSKSGELVSARRSTLKTCNVDKIIFLNKLYAGRK